MFENNGSLNLWTTLYSTIYTHSFYTTPPPPCTFGKKEVECSLSNGGIASDRE